ncbi:MAG: hypothetical protein E7620_02980 [Ruminococcaceae bacterium]|nr:hypothetical protein [Oscillospiraceae bacterium]
MLKRFLSLLLIFLMIVPFSACREEGSGELSPTVESKDSTTDTAPIEDGEGQVFQKSEASKFKIVYASRLANETMSEVNRLASMINSTCNTEMVITGDLILAESEKHREWEHEILIGCTNREESALFGEGLRQYDYGFGYVNGKIVIYGKSESNLKNAINSFLVNVLLGHKNEDIFYDSGWTSVVRYHYTVEKLTVNGASVREYEIIYPEASSLYEKEMAERLHCYVLEKTGYDLTVKKDSEPRNGSHAFHIGKTKFVTELATEAVNGHDGLICGNGGDIVAYGGTMTGMVNASKRLTELLVDPDSRENERTVTIDQSIPVNASAGYSVMTFNVFTGDMNSKRIDRVMDAIYRSLPDVMGLQEVNSTWMSHLQSKLSSYYGFVGTDLSDGKEGVPILYAKERFHLVESGCNWLTDTPDIPSRLEGQQYPRNYTYALLEDKATGERFLLLNTHWDTGGSGVRYAEAEILMRFLQGYGDVPVVLVGDLNAKRNSNELNYLKQFNLFNVFDCRELADMKKNSAAIDWIYMTSGSAVMTYHTYDDSMYNGDYPSDHYPYYAEFTIGS